MLRPLFVQYIEDSLSLIKINKTRTDPHNTGPHGTKIKDARVHYTVHNQPTHDPEPATSRRPDQAGATRAHCPRPRQRATPTPPAPHTRKAHAARGGRPHHPTKEAARTTGLLTPIAFQPQAARPADPQQAHPDNAPTRIRGSLERR